MSQLDETCGCALCAMVQVVHGKAWRMHTWTSSEPEDEETELSLSRSVEREELEVVPDSHDGAEEDTAGGRKRTKDWKKIVQKRRRMMGQSYVGKSKGEEVNNKPRVMGPRCQSAACVKSSKHHCSDIEEADREKIFQCFWENMNWEEKKTYVQGLIDVAPVKRRRGSSQRSSARVFFLNVNGQRLRVCRSLFLSTLGIKAWSAFNWMQTADTENAPKNAASGDIRDEAHEFMTHFLQDLPTVSSHCCRSSTSKQFLEPVVQSMTDLHKVYHRAAEEKMLRPFSRQVFSAECQRLNLGLYNPKKKDQCNACCSYKAGNLSGIEWQDHPLKKEEAHAEKVQDKNYANDKTMVVCMDLQGLLLCPRLKASALYYTTKLAIPNVTVYEMSTHNATCYVWHEGEGALSADEFASCVTHFLTEHKEHEEYILWSNGCEYQNRDSVLSCSLLKFSTEMKKVVTQKFQEKGHTQMECDSVHSVIERRLRNQDLYVPAEDAAPTKTKPRPYDVKYVDHAFFQDFTKLRLCTSLRPGNEPGDPTVHDIGAIRYNTDGDDGLQDPPL